MTNPTKEEVAMLRDSGAFDAEWYRSAYPDVRALEIDPADHYKKYGLFMGRSPIPVPDGSLLTESTDTSRSIALLSTPAELDVIFAKGVLANHDPILHKELVTILIPSHNNEKWLARAIHSALSQQGVQVEVILVDDGSTDGSVRVAQKIAQNHFNLKVISLLRNFGCYYARNIGLIHAKGQFITLLDSDDIRPPESIARQLAALKNIPGALACRGQQRRWTDCFSSPVSPLKHGENNLLWRREIIERIGFYDTVRYSGDSEFRFRFQRAYGIEALVKIPDEVYFTRTVSGSLTLNENSGVFKYSKEKLQASISAPRKIYADNFTEWQKKKKPNLRMSFPQFTRDFQLGSKDQNASLSLGQRRIGMMASFPTRRESLKATIDRILPQLDELRIYLNDYNEVPEFLNNSKIKVTLSKSAMGDLRDNGKFYNLPSDEGSYIFTLDDDLAYPKDYVAHLIHHVEMLGRSCVVGVHGVIFPIGSFSNLQQRSVFHFKDGHPGKFVDLLGTGTAAWHSSAFIPDLAEFSSKGVCDLWFSAAAAKRNIPMFSIPRTRNWLKEQALHKVTLFKEALKSPENYFKTYSESIAPVLNNGRLRKEMNLHLSRCYDSATLAAAGIEIPSPAVKTADDLIESRRSHVAFAPSPSSGRRAETEYEHFDLHFHILINGWNCRDYLPACLRSVAQQLPASYSFEVTLIDDQSTDGTFEELARTTMLPHAKLIRITENTGPAHARHIGISAIREPDTVVVLLDMDDALEPHALRTVAKCYRDNSACLLTIGNWHDQNGQINPQSFYTAEEIDSQRIREIELFNATHLRTFRRHLYDAVEISDLLDHEGKWLETCTDVALMYPLIDQCRSHEVMFIHEPIYRYTRKHSGGTLARFGKAHKIERLKWLKSKTPKARG